MKFGADINALDRKPCVSEILARREPRLLKPMGSPAKAAGAGWAGPSIIILLFVVSTVYVVFGGVFELDASRVLKTQSSITVDALEAANVSVPARGEQVPGSSSGKAK